MMRSEHSLAIVEAMPWHEAHDATGATDAASVVAGAAIAAAYRPGIRVG